MKMKWHGKWRNTDRMGAQSGPDARSSALTTRCEAISMSFGFDRIGLPLRREGLENEPHFLRFRSLKKTNLTQTISTSFMGPSPRALPDHLEPIDGEHRFIRINGPRSATPHLPQGEQHRQRTSVPHLQLAATIGNKLAGARTAPPPDAMSPARRQSCIGQLLQHDRTML